MGAVLEGALGFSAEWRKLGGSRVGGDWWGDVVNWGWRHGIVRLFGMCGGLGRWVLGGIPVWEVGGGRA